MVEVFSKLRRFTRIIIFTTSMYLVTHLIVFFYLFPVCTFRIILKPDSSADVKKQITGLLFTIIGNKPKVQGLKNIDCSKTYLVVSNYPGSYAGFALMNVFPDASILVHSFLSKIPLVGFILKRTGATFVQRKGFKKSMYAIDEALELNKNRNIIILPEGGRTPDGSIRKFKSGFIYILRHSSRDVLPITLRGFYTLKPLKRPYIDPDAELEIIIHNPIDQSLVESLDNPTLLKLTEDTISRDYEP